MSSLEKEAVIRWRFGLHLRVAMRSFRQEEELRDAMGEGAEEPLVGGIPSATRWVRVPRNRWLAEYPSATRWG